MATHSSVLAWRIPGMGWRGGLEGRRLCSRRESDTTEATQQQQQQVRDIRISQYTLMPNPFRCMVLNCISKTMDLDFPVILFFPGKSFGYGLLVMMQPLF